MSVNHLLIKDIGWDNPPPNKSLPKNVLIVNCVEDLDTEQINRLLEDYYGCAPENYEGHEKSDDDLASFLHTVKIDVLKLALLPLAKVEK